MVALVPSLQQVREIRTGVHLIAHEVLGKFLHVSGELVEIHQPVVVEVRDDHVFWIPRYVHYLEKLQYKFTTLE